MFDIGWSELVVIGVVALVVIGPKELPGMLRTVGGAIAKIRRMAGEFQSQFQEAMREAELDEARKSVDGLNQAASFNPLQTIRDEIQKAVETPVDKPSAAATAKLDIPDPPPVPDLTPEQISAAFEPAPAAPAAEAAPAAAEPAAAADAGAAQPSPPASSEPTVQAAAPPVDPGPRILNPGEPPPMPKPARRAPDPESAAG